MEQILRELVEYLQNMLGGNITEDELNNIVKEYYDTIVNILPKMISEDCATYSNEASYIRGWNACVEKIVNGIQ